MNPSFGEGVLRRLVLPLAGQLDFVGRLERPQAFRERLGNAAIELQATKRGEGQADDHARASLSE